MDIPVDMPTIVALFRLMTSHDCVRMQDPATSLGFRLPGLHPRSHC